MTNIPLSQVARRRPVTGSSPRKLVSPPTLDRWGSTITACQRRGGRCCAALRSGLQLCKSSHSACALTNPARVAKGTGAPCASPKLNGARHPPDDRPSEPLVFLQAHVVELCFTCCVTSQVGSPFPSTCRGRFHARTERTVCVRSA
jgi:hypothetical protein